MTSSAKELLEAGVHFGHQLRRWNPKSKEFVFDNRHGISIINLEKTEKLLKDACDFIEKIVASGKDILLVGTKKQAQEIIRDVATSTSMPFCANRWLGGFLTNFETIKSSLEKYRQFLKMEQDGSFNQLANKKEVAAIRRQMNRMHRNFEGVLNIKQLPAAIFVVDTKTEDIAVNEARKLGIPVIALVDTNSDPTLIDHPIPGNDDAVKSIRIIAENIMEAIQNGLNQRSAHKASASAVNHIAQQAFDRAQGPSDNEPEVTIAADIQFEGKEES